MKDGRTPGASVLAHPFAPALPAAIDEMQAARYLGAAAVPDAATAALLKSVAPAVLASASPRAVWAELTVSAARAAQLVAGEDIEKHLRGCEGLVLLAVTLGTGTDAAIRRAGVGNVAALAAADALASALAEQVADAAEGQLRVIFAKKRRYLTGRYSPGYGDYPLTTQPRLCGVLDTARTAGLAAGETLLLTPRKSVTAVLGISTSPVKGYRAGCTDCALREGCEMRKRGLRCADE